MKEKGAAEGGKRRDDAVNTVVRRGFCGMTQLTDPMRAPKMVNDSWAVPPLARRTSHQPKRR